MVKRFSCSNQTEWGGNNLRLSKFDPYASVDPYICLLSKTANHFVSFDAWSLNVYIYIYIYIELCYILTSFSY